jgi:hypothetical protein
VSWNEQSNPVTRRLSRQGIATWLQCTLTDIDVRQHVLSTKYCNSFYFPLYSSP